MRGIKEKCTQGFGAEIQSQELEDLDTDVRINTTYVLTHCGRVTQICIFNTVKLGTSASSP